MSRPDQEPCDDEAPWRFSLAFYSRPGVSEALIALQDHSGCDVNLMLFALWLGFSGRSRLNKEELAVAEEVARPIRADIVEPLRALRRKLRPDPDPAVQRLREGIKALELSAERIVLSRLADSARAFASNTDQSTRAEDAYENLALYLGADLARRPEVATIRRALEAFVRD